MADTGKQSPLGINLIGSYLSNTGLTINPIAASYMGYSKKNDSYTPGKLTKDTCLRLLTYAINDGYLRGVAATNTLTNTTYDNLISIGSDTLGALGNSKPPTYEATDPSGVWTDHAVEYGKQHATEGGYDPNDVLPCPATSAYGNYNGSYGDSLQGYGIENQKQNATWLPYDSTNPNKAITQWGWIRCHALQAWNEFNYNGSEVDAANVEYKEFCSSFMSGASFIAYQNQAIMAAQNARTFLDGAYSNMNDLISADVAGISLSSREFGTDLENLGKASNLKKIDSFGLPSNLLVLMGENNAITQDLSLALLASGLTTNEVSGLVSGLIATPSKEQEQKIYSAFLIIQGENLAACLAPLQCRLQGLVSLADLLDVKQIFPNSYPTLTVPKYNSELGLPTNSKTYYPIFKDGSINQTLLSPEMQEYVGTQTPKGNPPINSNADVNNFGAPPIGFGSYLEGILPKEQAIAAGALQFTMRQVKKIEELDFKKFAKIAKAMENVSDLPLVGGTSKPTNQQMLDNHREKEALGSGPYGTYTFSDLFGCMSGLPYPWEQIYNLIYDLSTTKLFNIYRDLYLAVSWEQATVSVQYSTTDVSGTNYYAVTGVTITESGGGYGRGTTVAPTITFSDGTTATVVIGTDDTNIGSNGSGTYGRVTSITNLVPAAATTSIPTATIQAPPTATLPVDSNGNRTPGVNTSYGTVGWPSPMNSVVQAYIDQANTEINSINQTQPEKSLILQTYWNILGSQLMIEQRTRYIAFSPVQVPKNYFANPYPMMINVFSDSMPNFSQDTRPHMAAQTIEAITDYNSVGGQSGVAMMRQERNQKRLQEIGVDLDNNVPDSISQNDQKAVTTNGTIPAGLNNSVYSPLFNLVPEEISDGLVGFTTPSWPRIELSNPLTVLPGVSDIIYPQPNGVYVPNDSALVGTYLTGDQLAPGDISPILKGNPNPSVSPLVPVGPLGSRLGTGILGAGQGGIQGQGSPTGVGPSNVNFGPGSFSPESATSTLGTPDAIETTTSTGQLPGSTQGIVIIQPPAELDPSNVPINLDPNYTSSTLMPSSPNIEQAIAKVIECNCDCWLS